MIPYGRQSIGEDDIAALVDVLRSDWITTGPKIDEFEEEFAGFVQARHAVAVSSGTAALHAAMFAAGVRPGDEVIVPCLTFAASANAVVHQGARPVFADVDDETLLIDPRRVESLVNDKTKAIVAVDYSGQTCDFDALREVADSHGLVLLDDACHSIGGGYRDRAAGSLADLNTFSLHPVKNLTTGEGGMVTTDNRDYAEKMRRFRNHGITSDHRRRADRGTWFYEMVELGYNYRITDFQCALGISQLRKLPGWIRRRREIASRYTDAFASLPDVRVPRTPPWSSPAWHLYVLRIDFRRLRRSRQQIMDRLREKGVGTQVHFIPVHLHPYYKNTFGTRAGLCPVAEAAYEQLLSLPVYPAMSDVDVNRVITAVSEVISQAPPPR